MDVPSARGTYRVELVRQVPLRPSGADEAAIFFVDARVWKLHGSGVLKPLATERRITLAATERLKTLDGVARMAATVLDTHVTRKTRIVAIGGGTLQDAVGFLASILHRGLEWSFVPTTLLAQADSCIGGKTSINYQRFKNVLGTFHPPRSVTVWPGFLDTLTDDNFRSGVGEMAKLHLLAGPAKRRLWERSRQRVLARDALASEQLMWSSLVIKRRYLVEDEFDTGVRQFLNFGHCFGHAIEAATAFRIPHGQAVVLGMELANQMGVFRGLMRASTQRRLFERSLDGVRTARLVPERSTTRQIIEAMGRDKKRVGKGFAVIVLDDRLRPVKLTDVTEEEIRATLDAWARSSKGPTR